MAATRQTVYLGTANNSSFTLRYWKGMVRPQIRVQFKDKGTDAAVDMSGHAGVPKLCMKLKDSGYWKIGTNAMYGGYDTTAVDNTIGDYILEFDAGDVDVWGEYWAWFDVQEVAGKYERVPSSAGGITVSIKDAEAE